MLLLVSALVHLPASAAGLTIENTDRNKGIKIVDARTDDSGARILYVTQPAQGQGHQSEKCTVNFYVLGTGPALSGFQPDLLVENYCGYFGMSGHLLANGDVLIIAGSRVETWRSGTGKIDGWQMGSLEPLGRLGTGPDAFSNLQLDVAGNGDVILASLFPRARNDTTSPSGIVMRVSRQGQAVWTAELNEPGVLLSVINVWAEEGGGAWLHVSARAMEGTSLPGVEAPAGAQIVGQNRLYRIDAGGELAATLVLATDQMQDFSAPPAAMPDPGKDPEAFQAALQAVLTQSEELNQGKFFGYGDIAGHVRSDGGLDLLAGRRADEAELIRLDADGEVLSRTSLSEVMTAEGLREWIDFSIVGGQVVLYGTLGTRKNRLPQGYLSWIDLDSGGVITRLIPLSELGLEEARNAGDEDMQYLENNPAQQGELLTSLSGQPLAVSLVYRSRRQAIQLDEGTDQLLVYTEARDERRAQADKEEKRAQRNAARDAQKDAMNSEMAAAIGVSDEEYAAMSSKERKEAMVRGGDINAMMAAAMKQAELAQQQMAASQGAGGQAATAGMTPEMAAAMAQAQQAMADAGMTMPESSATSPAAPSSKNAAGSTSATADMTAENSFPIDSNGRGILEYEHPEGLATTLVIRDRESGAELLRKDYPDGSVYEYLDFGRYQTPLQRIAVTILDGNDETLLELTPVTANQVN
jgi:hypothetical protein